MVGPVFPVEGHFILLDHQNVQVLGSLHGMVDVEKPVLLAARCGCEDWTFQQARLLSRQTEQYSHFKTCAICSENNVKKTGVMTQQTQNFVHCSGIQVFLTSGCISKFILY